MLQEYKEEQGYPWPVGTVAPGTLSDYRVIRQATKVAVNGSGVITFRAGYGQEPLATWQQVFRQLVTQ